MPLEANMKNAVLLALFAALTFGVLVQPANALPPGWKDYRMPQGDFTVHLPAKIIDGWTDKDQDKEDAKKGNQRFMAVAQNASVLISVVPLKAETSDLDKQVKAMQDGIVGDKKDNSTTFKVIGSPSGPGWDGRILEQYDQGKLSNQILIAIDQPNGRQLTMFYTADPIPQPEFDEIVQSLKMDPEAIKTKDDARMAREWKELFAVNSPTDLFGLILLIGGGLTYMAAGVWFLYTAFTTSVIWGLVSIFVPFGGFVFFCTHATKATPPFVAHILGAVIAIIGVYMRHPV
jgi:hypothetical protein